MGRKAVIGISTSLITDTVGMFPGYERVYVNKDYIDAVAGAGGIPMMIPFNQDYRLAKAQAGLIDGLILSGGHDVYPQNYGQEPHPKVGETFPERDAFDFALLKEAQKRGIPILGICRGMQIINTLEGGDLYQDMSLFPGEVLKHWQGSRPREKTLGVTVEANSLLSRVYSSHIMVNSFHHQGVRTLARGFKVTARSKDGVIKAMEKVDYPFLLGIQWHPEMLYSVCEETRRLFELFVKKASS